MAHYQSFHSHEVTGFLSLSADTAEGEGVVLVDDSDDDQPVDDPAEEEVMTRRTTIRWWQIARTLPSRMAPGAVTKRLPWSRWALGTAGDGRGALQAGGSG